MKNTLKFGFVALAFAATFAACNNSISSEGETSTADTTTEIVPVAPDTLTTVTDTTVTTDTIQHPAH